MAQAPRDEHHVQDHEPMHERAYDDAARGLVEEAQRRHERERTEPARVATLRLRLRTSTTTARRALCVRGTGMTRDVRSRAPQGWTRSVVGGARGAPPRLSINSASSFSHVGGSGLVGRAGFHQSGSAPLSVRNTSDTWMARAWLRLCPQKKQGVLGCV